MELVSFQFQVLSVLLALHWEVRSSSGRILVGNHVMRHQQAYEMGFDLMCLLSPLSWGMVTVPETLKASLWSHQHWNVGHCFQIAINWWKMSLHWEKNIDRTWLHKEEMPSDGVERYKLKVPALTLCGQMIITLDFSTSSGKLCPVRVNADASVSIVI